MKTISNFSFRKQKNIQQLEKVKQERNKNINVKKQMHVQTSLKVRNWIDMRAVVDRLGVHERHRVNYTQNPITEK